MAKNETEKLKWAAFLKTVVADYRKNKPDCPLTDIDIALGIMHHFEKTGFIHRRADGKWMVPKLKM